MTREVQITETRTRTVTLDIDMVAAWFCELNDEQQADLFVAIARCAEGWKGHDQGTQWYLVGRHLATCECSTPEARDMILSLHHGLSQ